MTFDSRVWLRRLLWAAGIYLVLCAAAWQAVPWGVRRAFAEVPKILPGFQAGAERVRCNPFTMRLTLEGLSFSHEKLGEIAACRTFSVAANPFALLRLAVGLREIKLVGPSLTLGIGPDGGSILDVLPKSAPETVPDAQTKPLFIPRVVIGALDVSDGELNFESRLRQAPQKVVARPIDFRLENLSTIKGDGGMHRLQARTNRDEVLNWEGEMTVRPPHLWGSVSLSRIDLSRVSTAAPSLPVEIAEGRLDASTVYDVALDSRTLTASLKDARLSVSGLLWRLKGSEPDLRGPFVWDLGPAKVFAVVPFSGRMTLSAETAVSGTGSARLKAYLTPKPLAGGAEIAISALPLAPFSPLAPPPTQVSLDSGTLDLSARAALAGSDVKGELSLSLTELAVSDKLSRRPLARLGRLRVDSAHASTKDRRAEVKAVSIEKPYLRLARAKSGKTNIEDALGISLSSPAAKAPVPARPAPTGAAWRVRLDRFSVSGGRVLAQDESVSPPFAMTVSNGRADLRNLVSDGRSTATFSAGASIEKAPFTAAGTVRLSSAAAWVEAKLKADGIQLPLFSPYSGKVIGYKLDQGAFSFDLDHRLADRAIMTKNRAVMDQLTLGDKVESPDAIKAPIKIGLAILKDRRGVIDLNVPIDGSLDDPEFHIGGVIIKTLLNLIVKAAISPFSALSGMLGSKDDLGKVLFPPGETALTPQAADDLAKVAQALKDRPQMLIGVRGSAGRADALAAGDRVLLTRLRGAKADSAPLTPKEEAKVLALHEKEFGAPAPDAAAARVKLSEKWGASDAELRALAQTRAGAIHDALVSQGVEEARFFSQEPVFGAAGADEPCQLQLDVR